MKSVRPTPEERKATAQAAWRKYDSEHREERAAHNKEYVRNPVIRERLAKKRAEKREFVMAQKSGVDIDRASAFSLEDIISLG